MNNPWPIGTRLQNTDQMSKEHGTTGKLYSYPNDTQVVVEWTPGEYRTWQRSMVRVWDGVDITRGEKHPEQPEKSLGQICYEASQRLNPTGYPCYWNELRTEAQRIYDQAAQVVAEVYSNRFFKESVAKIETQDEEISDLRETIDRLKKQSSNSRQEADELQRDCDSLNKKYQTLRVETANEVTTLTTKNAALVQENDLLNRKLDEVTDLLGKESLKNILPQKETGVSFDEYMAILNAHALIVEGFHKLAATVIDESNGLKEELEGVDTDE